MLFSRSTPMVREESKGSHGAGQYIPKPGDIVGFSGNALSSAWINIATYGIPWWSLSHVGIIAEVRGRNLIFESTDEDNLVCEIQGTPVKGTQAHRLDERVASYPGKVWLYPLYRRLYNFESSRLTRFLVGGLGIPYDNVGAIRAGGIGWSWVESHLYDENLSAIFCSEWCVAAHRTIGLFPTTNVSRWSPNLFVRHERRDGLLLKPVRLK